MTHFQVMTIGDAKIDILTKIADETKILRLDPNSHQLTFKHGQKISLERCDILVGGNAANVAVGLSRLGLKTAIVAELGSDEFALRINNVLASEHVDRRLLLATPNAPSSLSIGLTAFGERTMFVKHTKREHKFNLNEITSDWIYLTSLGENWQLAYQIALDFVVKTGCQLAFNPGTPQIAAGIPAWREILARTDILFLNTDEAKSLLKTTDNLPITTVLKNLAAFGPKTIILTNGDKGAVAWENNQLVEQPAIPGSLVEKTGAGDAFASGVLGALINQLPFETALLWGARNSTAVISHVGAQTGLLTKEKMLAYASSDPASSAGESRSYP